MEISFDNIRQAEGMAEAVLPLKEIIEKRMNLSQQVGGEKSYVLTLNKVMRICLIASLSLSVERSLDDLGDITMSKSGQRIMASFFTKDNNKSLFSALLKLRYKNCEVDWNSANLVGRIVAKAIVYFIISKFNDIYELLPKQAVNEEYVQIRHFTIIDEAHYMLDFDNQPLRNLIAVGRNKGLSIILATQNMDSFKSKYFDYYANAQYPLIMKQQTIADGVIKDLFGVSGKEFQDIKSAIAGLQKGELIIKDNTMSELELGGKKYKKMKVTHLI